ncbi:MAG TPA: hypothetical protein VJ464_12675 [Blastocatellia bacterium]|nr:hypothetical protein [Blastocatellia bacterium]
MLMRLGRFMAPFMLALLIVAAGLQQTSTGAAPPPQVSDEDYSDQPEEAERYYLQKRLPADETILPAERYVKAMRHIERMPTYSTARAARLSGRSDYSTQAELSEWVELGPGNIGGRTRALLINPQRPEVMYAAGVAGGVWKTSDAGESWQPLDDLLPNLAVSSMAMDPTDPNIIYVGTGEGFSNSDARRGAGIVKTTDGGATWTYLQSTNNSDFYFVNDLVISRNTHRVYAGTSTGVWMSSDGGANWSSSFTNPAATKSCLDLAIRTDKPTDQLLAAFGNLQPATVFRNTDAAGTGVWTAVLAEPNMGRTALAIAPSNQDVVYAMAMSLAPGDYFLGLHAVFRSTDGGGTWTARVRNTDADKANTVLLSTGGLACGSTSNNQGWYDNVIAVDPLQEDRVWTGGVTMFRSDDGGASWGIAAGLHTDEHCIVFDPNYNGRQNTTMYVAGDGGIYRTFNARASVGSSPCTGVGSAVFWTPLNHNYCVTQFYFGMPYPDGKSYFGGTQDNGTLIGTDDGGKNGWQALMGGDGGYVAIDPGNPNILYTEFQNLNIRKSLDGGRSFFPAVTGILNRNFMFIVPFAMDPSKSNRLWTGSDVLWRTTDGAGQWTQASAPLLGITSAVAIAPADGNRVLIGTSGGAIHHSEAALAADSNTNWLGVTPRLGFVSWVAYDPVDPMIAYATYSSFNRTTVASDRHIYKTTDGGATWASIDGGGGTGIPDIPVHCIVIDPTDRARLYVGTDLGVFVSTDGGANWASENTGFAHTPVESLALSNSDGIVRLFAFTHGRGAYRVRLATFVSKITGATVNGKKLTVTGENFDSGAAILINGQEQGTKHDGGDSKGALISKKGGKKIAVGQTVTLRVRNGDGSLTPDFVFTRQ